MDQKSREGGEPMNTEAQASEEVRIFTDGEKRALTVLTYLTCFGVFVIFLVPEQARILGIVIPFLSVFSMICIVVKAGFDYKFRRK